jgi:hypothetical protein
MSLVEYKFIYQLTEGLGAYDNESNKSARQFSQSSQEG